jgi:hypothetical protein
VAGAARSRRMSHSWYHEQSRCDLESESETKRQFAQRRQRSMQSARLRMPSASVFQEPLLPDAQLPALVVHPQ